MEYQNLDENFKVADIGDVESGNYTEFKEDGTMVLHGEATTYEDVAIAGLSLPPTGVAAPEMKLFKAKTGTISDYAIKFNGGNPNATIPDNSAYDFSANQEFSLETWIKPINSTFNWIYQAGFLDIYFSGNSLEIGLDGTYRTAGDSLGLNAKNHLVITFSPATSTNTRIKVYVNGVLGTNFTVKNTIKNGTGNLYIGSYTSSGWDLDGIIDEFRIYDFELSQSQIDAMFNLGKGTANLPTGVNFTTVGARAVAQFKCNENTGLTTANANTITGDVMTLHANTTWTNGLIGDDGIFGYYAWHFKAGKDALLIFNYEFLHKLKLQSDASPHAHWSPTTDMGTSEVLWEIGFTWAKLGSKFPDLTIYQSKNEIVATAKEAFEHLMTVFADIDLSTNTSVSSILGGYIARRGTDAQDTYTGEVALHYVDLHMKVDSVGSEGMYTKYNS